jgi:quercetin dioxygenase-like cupin family protein
MPCAANLDHNSFVNLAPRTLPRKSASLAHPDWFFIFWADFSCDRMVVGGVEVTDETLFHHGSTMVRRLRIGPGEATPWHRDPFQRVAVVLRGNLLSIEYRDGGKSQRVEVTPGQVEWEEPSACVHRALNIGKQAYEQVTVFLLDRPDAVPQPPAA